jgi:hypothetical protein
MPKDERDVLEVLKFELDFIEKGGYGRSVRTPWLPTSVFQDSLTCINFGDPERSHPCDECLLMQFVPAERRSEKVPCHHIPLSPLGETVHTAERWETQAAMEDTVKNWLRAAIKRIEEERARTQPATPGIATPSA